MSDSSKPLSVMAAVGYSAVCDSEAPSRAEPAPLGGGTMAKESSWKDPVQAIQKRDLQTARKGIRIENQE